MANRGMEFHDSTFDGIERDGTNATLRFSSAYIHESEGEPGGARGAGWLQEVHLHVSDAQVSVEIPDLPCRLWDGDISLGGESLQIVPIPLDYEGQVEFNLEQSGHMKVVGTYVRLELKGKPKYVEEVPGSQ